MPQPHECARNCGVGVVTEVRGVIEYAITVIKLGVWVGHGCVSQRLGGRGALKRSIDLWPCSLAVLLSMP